MFTSSALCCDAMFTGSLLYIAQSLVVRLKWGPRATSVLLMVFQANMSDYYCHRITMVTLIYLDYTTVCVSGNCSSLMPSDDLTSSQESEDKCWQLIFPIYLTTLFWPFIRFCMLVVRKNNNQVCIWFFQICSRNWWRSFNSHKSSLHFWWGLYCQRSSAVWPHYAKGTLCLLALRWDDGVLGTTLNAEN